MKRGPITSVRQMRASFLRPHAFAPGVIEIGRRPLWRRLVRALRDLFRT